MKFNLRDLFWLTVVVGLGTAWWLSRASEGQLRSDLKERDEVITVMKDLLARANLIEHRGPGMLEKR